VIIVDAGVWALALTVDSTEATAARENLAADVHWVMPAHGPVETLRTIRRFEAAGRLSSVMADKAIEAMCDTEVMVEDPGTQMLREIWDLRHHVSPYDAAYVVLARQHDCALITFDRRLARAASEAGATALVP
jgi:predicted nucleic acid-binding protein